MENEQGEHKVVLETHSEKEAIEFMKGTHPSQQAAGPVIEPSGPSGPAPETPTGPKDTTDWKKKYDDLSVETTELKNKSSVTLTNPTYHRLSVIEKETPEELPVFQELAFGNPDPLKLWKMDFVRTHPQYKDRPNDVQLLLESRHPLIFDTETDKEGKEYKVAKMTFDLEVDGVRDALNKRLNAIEIPDPKKAEAQLKAESSILAQNWQPEFVPILEGFSKIKLEATVAENTVVPLEIEVSTEDKRKYAEEAAMFVLHNKLAKTPENSLRVKEYIEARYFADNRKKITESIAKQAFAQGIKVQSKSTHNSQRIVSKTTPPGETVDNQRAFVDAVTKVNKK